MMTNLFSGGRAIIDKHKRGEDVCNQAYDGDQVGGYPGRNSPHQPLPVTLH